MLLFELLVDKGYVLALISLTLLSVDCLVGAGLRLRSLIRRRAPLRLMASQILQIFAFVFSSLFLLATLLLTLIPYKN